MTTKLRELAEAMASYWQAHDCGTVDTLTETFTETLEAVWPQVFPIPEGAVRVRVAVSVGNQFSRDKLFTYAAGIDSATTEEEAWAEVECDGDTHRGIIEAWLPPIPAVPTIEATVAGGGA
jgi:hypothetical protein